ncbi:DUF4153 domain-containing protein [uncultured Selenomonas sp.]|uniref:DUF4153 domain-containing protein n=1 Tax=uncultured Selenomonas sp. TaxID=159275 RepID=UPI0028E89FD5|nr:DUF4153 domain-containing protein [uncultured Selenomonas sp.]
MNITIRILQLKGRAHELLRRFPVAVFWQTVLVLVGAGIILLRPDLYTEGWHSDYFEHLVRLAPAVFGAWMTAVTCRLFTDVFPVKKALLLRAASSAVLFLLLAYAWYGVENPSRQLIVGTQGICLALTFLALFLLERTNKALGLPALLFAAAFSIATSILLFLGLILCVAAFWALIITDADGWLPETTYLFSGLIAYGGWGFSSFLGALPNAGARYEFPAATEKLLLYLFFPVYLLLLLVLYLYVGKIIGAGEMPVGTMNWYASFALFGFAFFFGTLAAQSRLPLFSRFLKWALLLFLPILAVQLYGVWLRYEAYGLTTLRYTSMICTFCGIYALAVAFLRRKPQQVYLCAAILALIFSLTPLNVVDVPLRNQEARLTQILTENNLLQDGRIVKRDDTPPAVVDEIIDIAFYLEQDVSPLAAEVFDTKFNTMREFYYFHGEDFEELSIADYRTLLPFDSNNITREGFLILPRTDGTEERIDLRPYTAMLLQYGEQNEKSSLSRELQDYETGSHLLHFDQIAISRAEDGGVVWDSASGFVLVR